MDPNKKFIDFKVITLLRLAILVLAITMFFAPWTGSNIRNGGMGTIGGIPDPILFKSGFDYMVGCDPFMKLDYDYIQTFDYSIQTTYISVIPILIFIAMIFSLYQNKTFLLTSMGVSLSVFVPMAIWYYDILHRPIPFYVDYGLSYGFVGLPLFIILNVVLGIATWVYCDMSLISEA